MLKQVLDALINLSVLGLIGCMIWFIFHVNKKVDNVENDVRDLNGKTQAPKADNGCDLCCKECQDNDVCTGACIHATRQHKEQDE